MNTCLWHTQRYQDKDLYVTPMFSKTLDNVSTQSFPKLSVPNERIFLWILRNFSFSSEIKKKKFSIFQSHGLVNGCKLLFSNPFGYIIKYQILCTRVDRSFSCFPPIYLMYYFSTFSLYLMYYFRIPFSRGNSKNNNKKAQTKIMLLTDVVAGDRS